MKLSNSQGVINCHDIVVSIVSKYNENQKILFVVNYYGVQVKRETENFVRLRDHRNPNAFVCIIEYSMLLIELETF